MFLAILILSLSPSLSRFLLINSAVRPAVLPSCLLACRWSNDQSLAWQKHDLLHACFLHRFLILLQLSDIRDSSFPPICCYWWWCYFSLSDVPQYLVFFFFLPSSSSSSSSSGCVCSLLPIRVLPPIRPPVPRGAFDGHEWSANPEFLTTLGLLLQQQIWNPGPRGEQPASAQLAAAAAPPPPPAAAAAALREHAQR